jgi:hypothetical protein
LRREAYFDTVDADELRALEERGDRVLVGVVEAEDRSW